MGSALISVSYELALVVMMTFVLLALPWAIFGLDKNLGMAKNKNATLKDVFNMENPNLNLLSFARLFLFASRDFWFEVPLPFYLRSPRCEGLGSETCTLDDDCGNGAFCGLESQVCENINIGGGCGGIGWDRILVGTFLGLYIIVYGQVQSWTPQLVTTPLKQTPPNKLTEMLWGFINAIPTALMATVLYEASTFDYKQTDDMVAWLIGVVAFFAIIFAINSSIHSYLVVKYAKKEKIAVSVGLYYMSNAIGRLCGTIGSGLLYTYVGEDEGELAGSNATTGFAACFLAGTICSILAVLITAFIDDDDNGLQCGSCLTIR
jgi:hypothetical protein